MLLNAGGVIGSIAFGTLSEKWGGRRGAATLGMVAGMLSAPVYLFSEQQRRTDARRLADRLLRLRRVGHRARAICRSAFPTEARGVGTGFSYHVGVGIGAFAPYLIGALQDAGTDLQTAMLWCIIGGGVGRGHAVVAGPGNEGTIACRRTACRPVRQRAR